MADQGYSVLILTHKCATMDACTDQLEDVALDADALREATDFTEWLMQESAHYGVLFLGHHQQLETRIESYYLLCLEQAWPELDHMGGLEVRSARGEIFEGFDAIFHAEAERLTALEGEVLTTWFSEAHGLPVPDLDAEVHRRLKDYLRTTCRLRGFNKAAEREILPRWLEGTKGRQPRHWTWQWLESTCEDFLRELEDEAGGQPMGLHVYESLPPAGNGGQAPFAIDGHLVAELQEALFELPGGAQEYLMLATPLLKYMLLRNPELESIRPLLANEVFVGSRGTLWNATEGTPWLGEIAHPLATEHHGEVFDGLHDEVYQLVFESLVKAVDANAPELDDAAGNELVHDLIDEQAVLSMSEADLEALKAKLREVLAARRTTGAPRPLHPQT